MKVLFINDSTSNPNWGDRAAAISLQHMISEYGGDIIHSITEQEIYESRLCRQVDPPCNKGAHSDFAKRVARSFTPPILAQLARKFRPLFSPANSDSFAPETWGLFEDRLKSLIRKPASHADLLEYIAKTDLLILHGDGSMTGNGVHPRTLLFIAFAAKRLYKKDVIIVNHTADFNHPSLLAIATQVYPMFDDVVFRDHISIERCSSFCKGRYAADSAFLFKPAKFEEWLPVVRRSSYFDVWPDTAPFNPAQPYICIGGSSLYPYVSGQFTPMRGFSSLIKRLISVYPGQIILTVSDGRDQEIFRPIAHSFNLPLVGLTTPVQQVVDILGNAEAYIGGRWHPSIFAVRGGTPVIPISSNTFKMRAIAQIPDLHPKTFDALNLERDAHEIGNLLLCYLQQGNILRERLRKWSEAQAATAWENVSFLRRHAPTSHAMEPSRR